MKQEVTISWGVQFCARGPNYLLLRWQFLFVLLSIKTSIGGKLIPLYITCDG